MSKAGALPGCATPRHGDGTRAAPHLTPPRVRCIRIFSIPHSPHPITFGVDQGSRLKASGSMCHSRLFGGVTAYSVGLGLALSCGV